MRTVPTLLAAAALVTPPGAAAQFTPSPTAATYITAGQVQEINALPGTDRQLVSQDIGKLNLAVGVIHRGASGPARAPSANPPERPCGVSQGTSSGARGISHDHQTETYIIISGGGTLVTGGEIMNGNRSAPESAVTTVLNGPSCSGIIVGDVVSRDVEVGDIVIIPAGVPHGWSNIPDHVDYLSVRPDPDRVIADYVNPALRLR